ncbi:MAG: Hsp20/alpha crystallin family protein [Spirochaetes bacterium]|nr:Hsp20/alpha crystallin family protein [Spirochaetota bacterium]
MRWGLTKWDGSDLTSNSVFDDLFRMVPVDVNGYTLNPRIDVHEDEKGFYIKAEMPGLEEKDINVTLKDRVLTISGEKKEEKNEKNEKREYYYSERRFGSFTRTIALPERIKGDAVKAHYRNGILEIELPKDEASQPKKINISVN